MKLAFIFDVKFTEYDGKFYSINLAQDFWENRYLKIFDEIVVIGRMTKSSQDPSGKLVLSSSDKVTFKCIPACGRLKRIFKRKQEEKFIEEIVKDCDAVVCRGVWGVKVCKKLKKPYVYEAVICAWDAMWNHSFLGKLYAVPFFFKTKKIIKNSPYVLYVTNKFLQKRYPTKGKNVGVSNVALLEPKKEVLNERIEKINKFDNSFVLGTAAAIDVKYKGQRFVIKMLSKLKKKGITNYRYQLVGKGDNTKLKNLAKKLRVENQVEFLGAMPHDRIFDWLKSLDIYVQPSLQEGLPRAVIEAMSMGLPCICLKTGGMPELVEQKYICSKKGDIAKTLMKKVLFMSDKEEMIKCAKVNFEKATGYEKELLDKKRIDFYKEFAQSINKQ